MASKAAKKAKKTATPGRKPIGSRLTATGKMRSRSGEQKKPAEGWPK